MALDLYAGLAQRLDQAQPAFISLAVAAPKNRLCGLFSAANC
jgi:hypothetical protein